MVSNRFELLEYIQKNAPALTQKLLENSLQSRAALELAFRQAATEIDGTDIAPDLLEEFLNKDANLREHLPEVSQHFHEQTTSIEGPQPTADLFDDFERNARDPFAAVKNFTKTFRVPEPAASPSLSFRATAVATNYESYVGFQAERLTGLMPGRLQTLTTQTQHYQEPNGFMARANELDYYKLFNGSNKDFSFVGSMFQAQQTDFVTGVLNRPGETRLLTQAYNPNESKLRKDHIASMDILTGNDISIRAAELRATPSDPQRILGLKMEDGASLHPKMGVFYNNTGNQSFFFGTQNATDALSRTTTVEEMLAVHRPDSSDPNRLEMFNVVSQQIRAASETLLDIQRNQAQGISAGNIRTNFAAELATRINGLGSGALRVNEQIHNSVHTLIQSAAMTNQNVVLSMQYIEQALNPKSSNNTLSGQPDTMVALKALSQSGRLSIAVSDKSHSSSLGLFKLLDAYRSADPTKPVTQKHDLLRTLIENDSFTSVPTRFMHSKSMAVFDRDGSLADYLIGSSNLTGSARDSNIETALVFSGRYLALLDDKTREDIQYQYLHGLSNFSNRSRYQGLAIEQRGKEEMALKGLNYLKQLQSRTGEKAFTFENRYLIGGGKQRLVGASIQILNPVKGQKGYSFDVTFGGEYISGRGTDLSPIVYLNKSQRVMAGAVYKNGSDRDFTYMGYDEQSDTTQSRILAAGETYQANAFDVLGGLITTTHYASGYEARTRALIQGYNQLGDQSIEKSLSRLIGTDIMLGLKNLGHGNGIHEQNSLIDVLNYVRDNQRSIGGNRIKNAFKQAGATLATPRNNQDLIPRYDKETTTARSNALGQMLDYMAANVRDSSMSSEDLAKHTIDSFKRQIDISLKQYFDPKDFNNYQGTYNDVVKHLIGQSDTARSKYTSEVKKGIKNAFSTQIDGFAQPHTMNYSQGQQVHDLGVYGLTSLVHNIFGTLMGPDDGLGLIMNPYPLEHGETLGYGGQYLRSVQGSTGRVERLPFSEMFGGLNKIEGGAPRVHDQLNLAESMPTLAAITRSKYKKDTRALLEQMNWSKTEVDSTIDKLAKTTYDWYDQEDKEEDKQLLYYFPYAKTEQISQRMKNLTSTRPMYDASKGFIQYAMSFGTSNFDISDPTKIISGNIPAAISSQQFKSFQLELARRRATGTAGDDAVILRQIAHEWSMDERQAGKGFLGSERPRLLVMSMGATQLADYGFFNPEYRKDSYEYGMKYVKPHVIQATGTFSSTRQSPSDLQAKVNEQLRPGTIFIARDMKIQEHNVLGAFESLLNTELSANIERLTGSNPSISVPNFNKDEMLHLIANLSYTPTDSIEIIRVGSDQARKILKESVDKINEDNKHTNARFAGGKSLEFFYKSGVYSPGDNLSNAGILDTINNKRRIGSIEPGDAMFSFFEFSKFEGKGSDMRTGPMQFRIPAHSLRELGGITVLMSATVAAINGNTFALDLQVPTMVNPSAGMRPGTIMPKGPFRDGAQTLWQALANFYSQKDARGGNQADLLPSRMTRQTADGQVFLEASDIFAMIGPSQVKGFNAEMGLMLLEEQTESGIYKRATGEGGGAHVAEGLALMLLGRSKTLGKKNIAFLQKTLGDYLINDGREQYGRGLKHMANASGLKPEGLETVESSKLSSTLEFFSGLAALARPGDNESLEFALLKQTIYALTGNQEAQRQLSKGTKVLFDDTFNAHSLQTGAGIHTHEDTFATRPTGLLAFLLKASHDLYQNINIDQRMQESGLAEVLLSNKSMFSSSNRAVASNDGLLNRLHSNIQSGTGDINEIGATMKRRMIADKLSQLNELTNGDLSSFMTNRTAANTLGIELTGADRTAQRLVTEIDALNGSHVTDLPELLNLYKATNLNEFGAANKMSQMTALEAYGDMTNDDYLADATRTMAKRFGFDLANQKDVKRILTNILENPTAVTREDMRILEGVENTFMAVRTYIQTQRGILMPAEILMSKIATPSGNKNVTALEGHIARSLTAQQLKLYTYSPNEYTDIGSVQEALVTLAMIHEGVAPNKERIRNKYALHTSHLGAEGIVRGQGTAIAGATDLFEATAFTYEYLSKYTMFGRSSMPGETGEARVLSAHATDLFLERSQGNNALGVMTELANISRLPMGHGLTREQDIAYRTQLVLNIVEGNLSGSLNAETSKLERYGDLVQRRGRTLSPEDLTQRIQTHTDFQSKSPEVRALYTSYLTRRLNSDSHEVALAASKLDAINIHRQPIEDRIKATYNTNTGSEYLEGMKTLYKELDIRQTGLSGSAIARRDTAKRVLERSHFIALPQYTHEGDANGSMIVSRSFDNASTGVVLGLDILEKMSLLFQSESHPALKTQHKLIVKLHETRELITRLEQDTMGGNGATLSSTEHESLQELRLLMDESKIATLDLVNNKNSIRQATANRLNMMGASFIAMNSFLVGRTVVAVGTRADDAGGIKQLGGIARLLDAFRPKWGQLNGLDNEPVRRNYYMVAYREEQSLYNAGERNLAAWLKLRGGDRDGAADLLTQRKDQLETRLTELQTIRQPSGAVEEVTHYRYQQAQTEILDLNKRIAGLDSAIRYANGDEDGTASNRSYRINRFTWGESTRDLDTLNEGIQLKEKRILSEESYKGRNVTSRGILMAEYNRLQSIQRRSNSTVIANNEVTGITFEPNHRLRKISRKMADLQKVERIIARDQTNFNRIEGASRYVDAMEQSLPDFHERNRVLMEQRVNILAQPSIDEINTRHSRWASIYHDLHYTNRAINNHALSRGQMYQYIVYTSHVLSRLNTTFNPPGFAALRPAANMSHAERSALDLRQTLALGFVNAMIRSYNNTQASAGNTSADPFAEVLNARVEDEIEGTKNAQRHRLQPQLDSAYNWQVEQIENSKSRLFTQKINNLVKQQKFIDIHRGIQTEIGDLLEKQNEYYTSRLDTVNSKITKADEIVPLLHASISSNSLIRDELQERLNAQTDERLQAEIIQRSLYEKVEQLQLRMFGASSPKEASRIDNVLKSILNLRKDSSLSVSRFRAIHEEIKAILPDHNLSEGSLAAQAVAILNSRTSPMGPERFGLANIEGLTSKRAAKRATFYTNAVTNLTNDNIGSAFYQRQIQRHNIVATDSDSELNQVRRLLKQKSREYSRIARRPEALKAFGDWASTLQEWAKHYGNKNWADIDSEFVQNKWRQGYRSLEHLELGIIMGRDVDYSNHVAAREELEDKVLRTGVLVNRQGMPYSAANPVVGSAPGTVGHTAIDIIGELSKRSDAVNTLFKPTADASNTLMLISAFGFQFVGLGDYDGDSYQLGLNAVTKMMASVADLQNKLTKTQAKLDALSSNNAGRNQLEDERTNLESRLTKEHASMQELIETNKANNATTNKVAEGLRSYTSSFLALPEELVGDKLMSHHQVFGDNMLNELIKQFRDTIGGISDRASEATKNNQAMAYVTDLNVEGVTFDEAKMNERFGARDTAAMIKATREWHEGFAITEQLEGIVKEGNLPAIISAFSRAQYSSESVAMSVMASNKMLGNITGSQINPGDLGSIQAIMGKTGGGLLGKVYNTIVPVVGTMVGDLSMHRLMQNPEIKAAFMSSINANFDITNSDSAVQSTLDSIKNTILTESAGDKPWALQLRELEEKNAISYRLLLTTQQFLRDAALKPKNAGGLVAAGRDFTLSEAALAQVDALDIDKFVKNTTDIGSGDLGGLIKLRDLTGHAKLLDLSDHIKDEKKRSAYIDIISQDLIGSVANTALEYYYSPKGPNSSQIDYTLQQSMTAFAALQLVTDYAGSTNKTAEQMMTDSLYAKPLQDRYDMFQKQLDDNEISDTHRASLSVDNVSINKDLLVKHVVADLLGKFQSKFIVDGVLENYDSLSTGLTNQALAAYGIELDANNEVLRNNSQLEDTATNRYLHELNQHMLTRTPERGVDVQGFMGVSAALDGDDAESVKARQRSFVIGELNASGYTDVNEVANITGQLDSSRTDYLRTLKERRDLIESHIIEEKNKAGKDFSEANIKHAVFTSVIEQNVQNQMGPLVETMGRLKEFNDGVGQLRKDGMTNEFNNVVAAMQDSQNMVSEGVLNEMHLAGAVETLGHAIDAGKVTGNTLPKAMGNSLTTLVDAVNTYIKSISPEGASTHNLTPDQLVAHEALTKSVFSYMAIGGAVPAPIISALDKHLENSPHLDGAQKTAVRQQVYSQYITSGAPSNLADANAYTHQMAKLGELNNMMGQLLAPAIAEGSTPQTPEQIHATQQIVSVVNEYEEQSKETFKGFVTRRNADGSTQSGMVENLDNIQREIMSLSRKAERAGVIRQEVEHRNTVEKRMRVTYGIAESMSLLAVPLVFAAMQGDLPFNEQVSNFASNALQVGFATTTFDNSVLGNIFNPDKQQAIQAQMMRGHQKLQYGRMQEYLMNIPSPTEALLRGSLGEILFSGGAMLGGRLGQFVDNARGVQGTPGETGVGRLITEVAAGSIAMIASGIISKRPIPGTVVNESDFAGKMMKQVGASIQAIQNYLSQNLLSDSDNDEDFEAMDADTGASIAVSMKASDALGLTQDNNTALSTGEWFAAISQETDSRGAFEEVGLG